MNSKIRDAIVFVVAGIILFYIGINSMYYPHQDVTQSDYKNPYEDTEKVKDWAKFFDEKLKKENPQNLTITYFFCGKDKCFFADEYGNTRYLINRSGLK